MKKLNELFNCNCQTEIKDIKTNSKYIEPGDLFVAIIGVTKDRHEYIEEAINNGASALVISNNIKTYNVPTIKVRNTNNILSNLCSNFYNNPEEKLFIIGITGTNGKTTTAMIIKDLLYEDCGYIGTLGAIYKDIKINTKNTTPDAEETYKILDLFYNNGCKIVVMEVSSEALLRNRNSSLKYDIAIITNITRDHLNIHKTLRNYINCKYKLFKKLKNKGIAILNTDDKYFKRFNKRIRKKKLTYGKNKKATISIKDYVLTKENTYIKIEYNKETYEIDTSLKGEYNIYNLCASILVLLSLNHKIEDILNRLNRIKEIEGRNEIINFNQQYTIILDYAHTPDALNKVLEYLNIIKNNRIITVTGSAGGRDKEKRGEMGYVVLNKSDYVIFTMDDPRYEDVNSIIDDMTKNTNKNNYERIINRTEAIEKAFKMAEKDDIVLIAGKGRDNYMAIEDKYIDYNDYEVIENYFKKETNHLIP